jgi:hypothetical protein
MAFSDFLPFRQTGSSNQNNIVAKALEPEEIKSINRVMKVAALALGFQGSTYYYNTRATFEPSPYDFDRIMQAVDTDSYVKQAMAKYRELFWKEGWKIVGENPEAVSYLYQRIDYMEMAMKRSFLDFLTEVSDQLFKFANAFIVKARGDISGFFPTPLNPINAGQTVVGYYLVPTEQVRILRDKFNRPKSYQQSTDPLTYSPTERDPVWTADRVIHMALDKKTGRAFGTPFLSAVLDDIIALRQMEEDIQNLVHRELFPLYKYKVGTPEQPAEPDEITAAAIEIEAMRAEGGLVIPHRHDIDVVNSGSAGLNASPYLDHFKERVAVGLGLAPHHLGMVMNGGNRSVTDRLDTALYDKIKQYQKLFAEMVRVHIFNELLLEGGFDPVTNPTEDSVSDRCFFKFNEIDVDTQVKKETHIIQKYTNSTISLEEARIELGLDPDYDIDELFPSIQGKVQIDISAAQAEQAMQRTASMQGQSDPAMNDPKKDGDKQQPASKGSVNLPNNRRGPGNATRPANQYDRKSSPDIRRSDAELLKLVENLLESDYNVVYSNEDNIKD